MHTGMAAQQELRATAQRPCNVFSTLSDVISLVLSVFMVPLGISSSAGSRDARLTTQLLFLFISLIFGLFFSAEIIHIF